MATLSREMLLRINTEGTKQATQDFNELNESIDQTSESTKRMSDREIANSQRFRVGIQDRIRQSKAYQQVNANTNGQLDDMVMKTQSVLNNLRGMVNIKTAPLASGLGYLAYQLKSVNDAGRSVNQQLDGMQIKLAATIKQSKGLSSVSQANKASQEYVDYARKFAATTPFEQTEVIGAMSNLAPVFKGDMKKIKSALDAAAILAQIDPAQGFEGAVYALREAASGSTQSLSARFELSKSLLNKHVGRAQKGDIGSAVVAALKENGQTLEMVNQFSNTEEGMQSNMADAKNFIAGNFNRPIYEQQKRGMYYRMQQQQKMAAPSGGLDSSMTALGQGFGLMGTAKNLAYQAVTRPLNTQRMKVLEALAPGMVKARYALEEKSTKLEYNDMMDRYATLDTNEKQRLKDLRLRLRELPIEAAKADREAKMRLSKQADIIAKVLGLNPIEAARLKKWMKDFSKSFEQMVENISKSFQSGGIAKFIKQMQYLIGRFTSVFIKFPQDIFKGLEKSGALRDIGNMFREIGAALTDLGKTIFGDGYEFADSTSDVLSGVAKAISDAIIFIVNITRPILAFLKTLIVGVLTVVKWVAKVAMDIINGLMGALALVSRLSGGRSNTEDLERQMKEARDNLEAAANMDPNKIGRDSRIADRQAKVDTLQGKIESQQKKEEDPKYESQQDQKNKVIGLATSAVSAIFGFGVVKNIKNAFGAAAASGTNIISRTLLGAGGVIKGAMALIPGLGIKESFKPRNLIQMRGLGGGVLAGALNVLFPGTPIAMLANALAIIGFIRDIGRALPKLLGGFGRTLITGIKEIPNKIMAPFRIIGNIGNNIAKFFKSSAPDRIAALRGMIGNMGDNIIKSLTALRQNILSGAFVKIQQFGGSAAKVIGTVLSNLGKGMRWIAATSQKGLEYLRVTADFISKTGQAFMSSKFAQGAVKGLESIKTFFTSGFAKVREFPSSISKIFTSIYESIVNSKFIAMIPKLLGMLDPIKSFFSRFFGGALTFFKGIGPMIMKALMGITKIPLVGRFLLPVVETIGGMLGIAAGTAASAAISTGVAAYSGTQAVLSTNAASRNFNIGAEGLYSTGGNESGNSLIQYGMLQKAAQNDSIGAATRSALGYKDIASAMLALEEENKTRNEAGEKMSPEQIADRLQLAIDAQRANEADARKRKGLPNKPLPIPVSHPMDAATGGGKEGIRHDGGMIGKSGSYTMQAGEYVLPAGGFDFSRYSKSSDPSKTAVNPGASAKGLTELLTNNSVLGASVRYVEAILRLMGINPDMPNGSGAGSVSGAGGSITSAGSAASPTGAYTAASVGGSSTDKKAKFMKVMELAKQAGDPHPEVTAAQWALESGWGAKQSGKNNMFGIKARAGEAGTTIQTTEDGPNGKYKTMAKFRDYGSELDSIKDRVALLKTSRYKAAGYDTAQTPFEAAMAVKRGGYATDSNYPKLLADLMSGVGIDVNSGKAAAQIAQNGAAVMAQTAQPAPVTPVKGHEVKMGDINISGQSKDQLVDSFMSAQAIQKKEFLQRISSEFKNM